MTPSKSDADKKQRQNGDAMIASPYQSGLIGRDFSLPFVYNITTPKNTTQVNYLITTADLPKGRINKLWIEFPSRCAGLVGFQIWRGSRQIFPIPNNDWMLGDGFIVPLSFTEIMDTNPLTLELRTYNIDDTYSHRIMVIIEMSGLRADLPEKFQILMDALQE